MRAAALEIWLAEYGLRKTPETVDELVRDSALADDRRYFRLSNLGILGNRGIEPEKVFDTLALYVHDPDSSVRSAAINGLALLGTSQRYIAQLRQKAVPELIRFSQDPGMDETKKKWVCQALREITLQRLGNDPASWANWYASRH